MAYLNKISERELMLKSVLEYDSDLVAWQFLRLALFQVTKNYYFVSFVAKLKTHTWLFPKHNTN